MSHLDNGTLHALLDGEIASAELPPIEAHLSACAECRARLEAERAIRGEADGLVEALEAPAPGVPAAPSLRGIQPQPARRWVRDVAWAASVVLAAGLGYVSRGAQSPAVSRQVGADQGASLPASPPKVVATAPETEAVTGSAKPSPAAVDRRELRKETTRENRDEPARPAERKAALADALDSSQRKKAAFAAPEQVSANAAADVSSAGKSAPAAPAPATAQRAAGALGGMALRGGRRLDSAASSRLDEVVVTAANESAAKARAPTPVSLTFPDAIAKLGGTIRLIEGMVPLRVEAVGTHVRVIYPAAGGDLVLEQWRIDGGVSWKLTGPAGFPADSLERLTARVRE